MFELTACLRFGAYVCVCGVCVFFGNDRMAPRCSPLPSQLLAMPIRKPGARTDPILFPTRPNPVPKIQLPSFVDAVDVGLMGILIASRPADHMTYESLDVAEEDQAP